MIDEPRDADVVVDPNRPVRISPEAMRALKKATGRSFTDLLQDDDPATQFQVGAFAELHRREGRLGHMPDPADAMGTRRTRRNHVRGSRRWTLRTPSPR